MAGGPLGVKHPSKQAFTLAALLSALAFLFTMIAIFVPWSWKDRAVFVRKYIGLWQNCDEHVGSPYNPYTCYENDVDVWQPCDDTSCDTTSGIAGGSEKCRGFIVATQVFTIAGNVFAFLTLVSCALVLGKLWSKPLVLGLYAAMNAFLAFSCILVAFLMWIIYVETDCQANNPLFPIRNYSWGWILMVIATLWSFLAMLLAYVGLFNILRYKPFIQPKASKESTVVEGPMYLNPEVLPAPSPYGYPAPVGYPAPAFPAVSSFSPAPYTPYPMF